MMLYARELEKALEIVRKASGPAMRYFANTTPVEEKGDTSPVTIADREGERLMSQSLQEYFPEDGILGEEGTCIPSKSGRRWLIDPIDGTKDFVRGNPFWSIQLALQVGHQIVLGIIHCPCMDEMLYAADNFGCFWNNTRVNASEISQLDKSILMVSGFNAAGSSWDEDAVHFLTKPCWTVRCYGGSYDVIMLARGKADIWLSGRGMEWDYAPAQIIARECGALFLTNRGNNRIDAQHCIVCASGIEQEIRHILKIPYPA
jgi:histidinol-phosphatase